MLKIGDVAYFFKKCLLFLPILILISIINFKGAVSFMDKENEYAALLLNRHMIGNEMSLIDERLFQNLIIDGTISIKEVIVFGSSRSSQITLVPYLKKYKSFFNHSISSAVCDDFIALYEIYAKRWSQHPSVIILECSPWWLNKNYDQTYALWKEKGILNAVKGNVNRLCDLFSPMILQTLLKKFWEKNKIKVSGVLFPDGHRKYNNLNECDVLRTVQNLSTFYNIENFVELDKGAMLKFDSFIKKILSEKIRIIFFLPPYHHISYEKLSKNKAYEMIFKAQDFFIQCAKKYNIEVVGNYDPVVCECNEADFLDWQHTYDTATTKIFKNLLNSF
jgi:hypothetical protein